MPEFTAGDLITLAERPTLGEKFWPQKERIWAPFMLEDVITSSLWGPYVSGAFAEFQSYLVVDEAPVAVAQTMPITWDGTLDGLPIGWSDGMVRSAREYDEGKSPNTLMAIEISIAPEFHGQGVSYRMLGEVRKLAERKGFQAVIVAVRPSLKARYPLTPMERYARWTRPGKSGEPEPFDPWLRAHWRVGGEILTVAHPSMVIEATVDQWEEWTGVQYPESGDYVVEGALSPVQMDREFNLGRYVEPNVWVHHPITTARLAEHGA